MVATPSSLALNTNVVSSVSALVMRWRQATTWREAGSNAFFAARSNVANFGERVNGRTFQAIADGLFVAETRLPGYLSTSRLDVRLPSSRSVSLRREPDLGYAAAIEVAIRSRKFSMVLVCYR